MAVKDSVLFNQLPSPLTTYGLTYYSTPQSPTTNGLHAYIPPVLAKEPKNNSFPSSIGHLKTCYERYVSWGGLDTASIQPNSNSAAVYLVQINSASQPPQFMLIICNTESQGRGPDHLFITIRTLGSDLLSFRY